MTEDKPKVLVFEESDMRVRALERLLAEAGYEPIARVWNSAEDVWDALVAHDDIIGVVIYYERGEKKWIDLQELVDCVKPGLPVLAVSADEQSKCLHSRRHSTNDFPLSDLGSLIKQHLEGICAVCARHR